MVGCTVTFLRGLKVTVVSPLPQMSYMTDIAAVLAYAQTFLGLPYGAWDGEEIPRDDTSPFYACAQGVRLPEHALVAVQGVSCTGLTNIMRRFCGLGAPGVYDELEMYPGGTGAWYQFLLPALRQFHDAESGDYPVGALLFRPYRNFEDQGHVAVVVEPGLVIHSFPEAGVAITPILAGYYTGWVPAEAWLGDVNACVHE